MDIYGIFIVFYNFYHINFETPWKGSASSNHLMSSQISFYSVFINFSASPFHPLLGSFKNKKWYCCPYISEWSLPIYRKATNICCFVSWLKYLSNLQLFRWSLLPIKYIYIYIQTSRIFSCPCFFLHFTVVDDIGEIVYNAHPFYLGNIISSGIFDGVED